MKVNAISFMTFGNKSQIMKSAAVGMAGAAAGIAADTFVKGVSKPDNNIEETKKMKARQKSFKRRRNQGYK